MTDAIEVKLQGGALMSVVNVVMKSLQDLESRIARVENKLDMMHENLGMISGMLDSIEEALEFAQEYLAPRGEENVRLCADAPP